VAMRRWIPRASSVALLDLGRPMAERWRVILKWVGEEVGVSERGVCVEVDADGIVEAKQRAWNEERVEEG